MWQRQSVRCPCRWLRSPAVPPAGSAGPAPLPGKEPESCSVWPGFPSGCTCPRVSCPAASLLKNTSLLFPLSCSAGLSNPISNYSSPSQSGKGPPEIISSLLFFLIGSAESVLLLAQVCIPIPQPEIKEVPLSLLELCCGSSCPWYQHNPTSIQVFQNLPSCPGAAPRCEHLSAQTLHYRVTPQVLQCCSCLVKYKAGLW